MMASELGVSVDTARRAALLHDIGKAVSHEVEGPHALVGGKIARRHGEDEAVAHAMEAHHNEVDPRTVEAVIVQAADAALRRSARAPGATRWRSTWPACETWRRSRSAITASSASSPCAPGARCE